MQKISKKNNIQILFLGVITKQIFLFFYSFAYFGGNVSGKFQDLIPSKRIKQTWRLKQWPEGHFSTVLMEIEEKEDHSVLTLTQTGVPAAEEEATRNNWKRYYWDSIKQTFGFGSFLG